MAAKEALSIQLIRECILKHVTDPEDLKNLSMLNSTWYPDSAKRLESYGSRFVAANEHIIHYTTNKISSILKAKNIMIKFASEYSQYNKKYSDTKRAKTMKRVLLLQPRIIELTIVFGNSTKVSEVMTLLECAKNANKMSWNFNPWQLNFEDHIVLKLFEEVKVQWKAANLYLNVKSLILRGESQSLLDFFVNEFVQYLPKLDHFTYFGPEFETTKCLKGLDELGKLESLRTLVYTPRMDEADWNLFMKKQGNVAIIDIYAVNIFYLGHFLAKYSNQLEEVTLRFETNFQELEIPEMKNLRKLGFFWAQGMGSFDRELIKFTEAENAYPKLRELHFGAWDKATFMRCFSDISNKARLISTLTADFFMTDEAYIEWFKSGRAAPLLQTLNKLFPNANCKVHYDQMDSAGYSGNILCCKIL